jgi:hypothetical protein
VGPVMIQALVFEVMVAASLASRRAASRRVVIGLPGLGQVGG